MTAYTYVGGPLGDPNSYTVGGSTPMNPPQPGDTIDFPSGGSASGSTDVDAISVEGALTLTGDLQTNTVNATAAITVNAGGDLDALDTLFTSGAMTVQNGGQLEADGSTPSTDPKPSPSMVASSSYTDDSNFLAEGPTTVTFSNGAQVQTGGDPGDTDAILGGSFTVTTGAMLTASAIGTSDGVTWTFDQNSLTLTGGGNLAKGGAVGADLNGTRHDRRRDDQFHGRLVDWRQRPGHWFDRRRDLQRQRPCYRGVAVSWRFRPGDDGTLIVSGAATSLKIEGDTSIASSAGLLLIGNSGTGDLTINQGATVIDTITSTLADSTVGFDVASTGTVEVDGSTTSWQTTGTLDVGGDGQGQVTVQNKGSMTATQLDIAEHSDSGTADAPDLVTITGDGSSLTVADELDVGVAGVGRADDRVRRRGDHHVVRHQCDDRRRHGEHWAVGTVTVTDPGSVLTTDGTAIVGNGGLGTLEIENQGSVKLGALMVAAMSTSGSVSTPDMVTVDGSGSTLMVSNSVTVDSAMATTSGGSGWNYTASGDGEITVTNGGYMSIGQTLSLQAPSAAMTPPRAEAVVSGGYVEGRRQQLRHRRYALCISVSADR